MFPKCICLQLWLGSCKPVITKYCQVFEIYHAVTVVVAGDSAGLKLIGAHIHNIQRIRSTQASVGGMGVVNSAWISVQVQRRAGRCGISCIDTGRTWQKMVIIGIWIDKTGIGIDIAGAGPAAQVTVGDGGKTHILVGEIRRSIAPEDAVGDLRLAAYIAHHPAADSHSGVAAEGSVGHRAVAVLQVVFGKKRPKGRKKRIEQIVNGEVAGKATKEAIEAMQATVMVASIMPVISS